MGPPEIGSANSIGQVKIPPALKQLFSMSDAPCGEEGHAEAFLPGADYQRTFTIKELQAAFVQVGRGLQETHMNLLECITGKVSRVLRSKFTEISVPQTKYKLNGPLG